jgi:hypothetical protein
MILTSASGSPPGRSSHPPAWCQAGPARSCRRGAANSFWSHIPAPGRRTLMSSVEDLRSSPVSSLKTFDKRDFSKSLCHISDEIGHSPASGLEGFGRTPTMRREASADLRTEDPQASPNGGRAGARAEILSLKKGFFQSKNKITPFPKRTVCTRPSKTPQALAPSSG